MHVKKCLFCENEFETIKNYRKFCCHRCYSLYLKETKGNKEDIKRTCSECEKEFIVKRNKDNQLSRSLYCSEECRLKGSQKKSITTNLKKYGVENVSKLNTVKEKVKNTKIKHYGNSFGDIEKAKLTKSKRTKEDIKKITAKRIKTNLEKYGTRFAVQNESIKKRIRDTCKLKSSETIKKIERTNLKKYGVKYYVQTKEYKDNLLDKFGVDSPLKSKELQNKKLFTQKDNHTMITSKDEEYILGCLLKRFKEVKTQYKSNSYPFNCDFYIPELDLYIEYQGHWNHGKHPFNKDNLQDKETVEHLKLKNKPSYDRAIEVWTIRDPLKRETAIKNNLNWVEFFTIKEFNKWFTELEI